MPFLIAVHNRLAVLLAAHLPLTSGLPYASGTRKKVWSWKALLSTRVDLDNGLIRFFVEMAALLSLWIATHPYRGITHDGRLYTIQALNILEPGRYSEDLFFSFGSQDSLTEFSHVYGPLVSALGPAAGHFCACVLGAALWIAALIFLMRSLFHDRHEVLAAVLACIVLDASYGGLDIFHYGEGFTTPRIFAEALVMIALGLCLRRALIGASLCLAGALVIHPIMAATGIAVVGVWMAFEHARARRVIGMTIMTAVIIGILLAVAGVQPFARLLTRFDPEWFNIVWKRCGFGFLSRWQAGDLLHLVAVTSTLYVVYALGDTLMRRLIVCVAISSICGLLATLLGCDIFGNVFLVNIQPWRILWVATLLANAAIAIVLVRLPNTRFSRELFLWAAALSTLTTLQLQLTSVAALAQLAAASAFWAETRFASPLPKPAQLLFLTAPLGGAVITILMICETAAMPSTWQALALTCLAGAALTVFALCEWRKNATVLIICSAAATVLIGAALFDQRTGWQKFIESPDPAPELKDFVSRSHNIYWDGGLKLLWFKLGRPSYYSCLQGTGAMFYRGTAIEYERRNRALSVLNTHDFSSNSQSVCFPKPLPDRTDASSVHELTLACRSLPELDAIVLTYRIGGAPSTSWVAPVEREYAGNHVKTYYKYLCDDFR